MRVSATLLLVLLVLGGSACSRKKTPKAPKPPQAPVRQNYTENGIASWYGHPYHGRKAANGEVYDMEKMTAAHRTLPFDTMVDVENLQNGKKCTVRITDRGPFIEGRIIDLSHAAARRIDLTGPGTAKVRLNALLNAPMSTQTGWYAVQVGSFRDKGNAEKLKSELEKRFTPVQVSERETDRRMYRVLVGAKPNLQQAEVLANTLRDEFGNVFVLRLE